MKYVYMQKTAETVLFVYYNATKFNQFVWRICTSRSYGQSICS